MLGEIEKAVLKAIRLNDGQLKNIQQVANETEGFSDLEQVKSATRALVAEGYVMAQKNQTSPGGEMIIGGPYSVVDHKVNKLSQGGVI